MLFFIYYLSVTLGATLASNGTDIPTDLPPSVYCFRKISSGERLAAYDVTRIVEESTVRGCEQECNIYKCTHFSFGFSKNWNGTCELTTDRQIARRPDPNFDSYIRTTECVEGKPTGYEEACYRRIFSGKRLHEKFIRHYLPCNSLEACQHQCSIEKHFDCQGFNIRLDPERVGRGICELSSVATNFLNPYRDFVFDPEFVYYERVYSSEYPNCGYVNQYSHTSHHHSIDENSLGPTSPAIGGPYYGEDSYGPWSKGHGSSNRGPWGSRGYGSGFFESNNRPGRPLPSFQPNIPFRSDSYGHGGRGQPYPISHGQRPGAEGKSSPWDFDLNFQKGPYAGDRGFVRPKGPTYIIIDADVNDRNYGRSSPDVPPSKPDLQYLPVGKSNPPPRPQDFPDNGPTGPHTSGPPPQNLSPGPDISPRPDPVPTRPNTIPPGSPGEGPSNRENQPKYPLPGSQNVAPETPRIPTREPEPPRIPTRHPEPPGPPQPHPNSRIYPDDPRDFVPTPPDVGPRPHVYPAKPHDFPPKYPDTRHHPPPSGDSFYRPPVNYPHPPLGREDVGPYHVGHEVCFQRIHPGYRLNPDSIRGMYDLPSVLDCEAMCTGSSFKCTGYSFRYSTSDDSQPNCLLTDFTSIARESHLLPDRSCDVYFKMSSCLDFDRTADTECFLKITNNKKLAYSKIAKSVSVPGISDCELACLNSGPFTCRSFSFRHGPAVIGEAHENCFLSDWPVSALTIEDFASVPNHEVYERGSYGHGCELDVGTTAIGPELPLSDYPIVPQITYGRESWNLDETWRHYTVSGWPCKAGTQCEVNAEAGFWSCQVEGGDNEQWDYCCRPKHSCGYSRGYNYPWCYVGEARPDQWRPCSEKYYPEFGNRFTYKPVKGFNSHLENSYGLPRDKRPWNFGDDFGPPSYWPISYLYSEAPPNETIIWDEDDEFHHHYHYHGDPDHVYEHDGDSPTIKFKSNGQKFPYPKAIIQKLDLNKSHTVNDPGDQMQADKAKESKKFEPLVLAPDAEVVLQFPSESHAANEIKFLPTPIDNTTTTTTTVELYAGKRELGKEPEANKSKEVIKTVDKIIEENAKKEEKSRAETEKEETLKKEETKYSGFLTLSDLENLDVSV